MSPARKETLNNNHRAKRALNVGLTVQLDPNLLLDFPGDIARDFAVIPIYHGGNYVIVAAREPLRPEQIDELHQRLGLPVRAFPCEIPGFEEILEAFFGDPGTENRSNGSKLPFGKQNTKTNTLAKTLFNLGLISREELSPALKRQLHENSLSFAHSTFIDRRVRHLVPEFMARQHHMLPVGRIDGQILVATHCDCDPAALAEIRERTGLTPTPLIFEIDELSFAIDRCYARSQASAGKRRRLGEVLVSRGFMSPDQLADCLLEQRNCNEKLGQVVVRNGYVSEELMHSCLSESEGDGFTERRSKQPAARKVMRAS
ncbi:MAG TPA: hypothetical protein VGQ81_16010 [Acidobacteriota bacterium]|nr:hypothetical protein [Acidobacteriota bacterium]